MASNARPYKDCENSDDDIGILMVSAAGSLIQPLASLSMSARERSTKTQPTVSPTTFPSVSHPFAPLTLAFGDVSEKGSVFVPFKLVQAYPRMYVGKTNQGPAIEYFKETLFKGRVWDFFCLGDPTQKRNPLLLVPTVQFEKYLHIANHELDMQLAIPRGGAGQRFTLIFGNFDTPRPRFLGRVNSASALEALKGRTHELPADGLRHLTPACYRTYLDNIDEIYDSIKARDKKRKEEMARQKRMQRQKDSGRMLKRVQKYLGLRRATSHVSSNSSAVTSWDVSKIVPFKARESVRFVSVDVEAYERDTRVVTEIGLAVLDTDDIVNVQPGKRGENWFPLVQAYHFRVKERSYIVNSEFVQGCPEAFDFGKSEMVPLKDIKKAVGKILGDHESEDRRPVIIVGHDIGQDLNYLLRIGYNPWRVSHIVDEVDTKTLFQRIQRSPNGRGLATMCAELGIPGCHYHNGGNDAVYTLRAMITIAIKRTVEGLEGKEEISTSVDEWSDGDMDDGGRPERSSPPDWVGNTNERPQNVRW
ncbi:hypothetical protein EV127DRAFT_480447 [Xylaria flabelliformis]|nr:hypothetical protein EV127DRAFT_480447 [Xylaria flabelliformis]